MPRLTVRQHVQAPLATTFEYFADFESYSEFMKGVRSVSKDGTHDGVLRFSYGVAGVKRTYSVKIDVDRANHAVSWRSVDGPEQSGTAGFHEVRPDRCALTLDLDLRSGNLVDTTGAVLGFVRNRIEQDLHRFAAYVERETGSRPAPDAPDHRAPSEKLFDAVFPTDERRRHP